MAIPRSKLASLAPVAGPVRTGLVPFSTWVMAARPRTLGLSVSPVLVGTAMAWASQREVNWPTVFAALVGSVCIQLGTNLHNDAADSERGGDGPDRLGPPRVTASGLASARSVKRAAAGCFATAAAMGLYLVAVGGWPILLLGLLSILSGWAYTGGPWPIAYTPFGEAFVAAFFGVGAVGGTYWLCTGSIDLGSVSGGLALGLLSAGVLLVNNFRDREADARVGRRTFPIVAGPRWTAALFTILLLAPYALLPAIATAWPGHPLWLVLGLLPQTLILIHGLASEPPGPALNWVMVKTVQLQVSFSAVLATGLLL